MHNIFTTDSDSFHEGLILEQVVKIFLAFFSEDWAVPTISCDAASRCMHRDCPFHTSGCDRAEMSFLSFRPCMAKAQFLVSDTADTLFLALTYFTSESEPAACR